LMMMSATPTADVVLSRRSGVALPRAQELAANVAEVLKRSVTVGGPTDASACKGKRACLLEGARKRGVSVVVTVEVGAALSEGSLRVEALSVDEDGRSLALVESDGKVESLVESARAGLETRLVPALRAALGLTPKEAPPPPPIVESPPPVVTPPAVTVTEPPPVAIPPAVTTTPEAPASGWSGTKIAGVVLGGVGVLGLGLGAGFGIMTLGNASELNRRCPAGSPCTDPQAYASWQQASQSQTIAGLGAGIGGAALIGGIVLFLASGSSAATPPAVTVSGGPTAGGGMAEVRVRF